MNKQNKAIKPIFLSALVLSILFSNTVSSFASNPLVSSSKKQAYLEFTKIIYNKSIYTPYKIELLKRLAVLNGIDLNIENQDQHDFNVEESSSVENNILSLDDFKKKISTQNLNNKTYFASLINELNHSSDSNINEFSRTILSLANSSEYFDLFKTLLNSKSSDDRIIAINGLSRIGNEKSLNLLINSYKKADFSEKKLLLENIGKFKNIKSISFCKETIKEENNPELLVNLYVNMINYGIKEYLPYYLVKLNDKDLATSKYATLKLNNIIPDIDYKYLKNTIYSNDGISKLSIASYFDGRLNNKIYKPYADEIITELGKYASENAVLLKITSIKTLCNSKNPEVIKVLRPYLKDTQLSDTVINIILSSKNPELLPLIKEISNIENDIIKFYSAIALLGYDDNLSIALFKKLLLDSESDNIRLISAYIVDKLSEPNKIPYFSSKKIFISYIKNFENTDKILDMIYSTVNDINMENYNLKTRLAGRSAQILPSSVSNGEISKYLTSEDNWVKLNASLNLLKRNDKSSIKVVREIINQNQEPKLISAAIEIIGNYGDSSDIQMLLKKLDDNSYARVKGNTSLAIIEITKRLNY